MYRARQSGAHLLTLLALACGLAACTSSPNRAPVEVRQPAGKSASPASGNTASRESAAASADADAKPGYYSVKPGDTLVRIALDAGQNWKDLARWNGLDNPNLIEVGQVLRVVAPGVDPAAAGTRPTAVAKAEPKPLEARPAAGVASVVAASPPASTAAGTTAASGPGAAASSTSSNAGVAASAAAATAVPPAAPPQADDAVGWLWPAAGPVTTAFDDVKSKGIAIAGTAGDAVQAAADGRVVYAGSGLRGYGNLVIVKHNSTYLTAYAHNQTLLVKEDQAVRRGQKIAEMGSTDAERVQLHFEIRKLGKPVDPAKLLPPR